MIEKIESLEQTVEELKQNLKSEKNEKEVSIPKELRVSDFYI